MVEVLPPRFKSRRDLRGAREGLDHFTAGVRDLRGYADLILVANSKDQGYYKPDTLQVASGLKRDLRIATAPVVVVRDQNRPQFLSTVLSAFMAGMKSVMVAWGDDYPGGSASNVRDFRSLAGAIAEAARIREMAGPSASIFAPVNLNLLSSPTGASMAKGRIAAGADLLMAQPPTTDPGDTFTRHLALIDNCDLRQEVLFNVFPFKDRADVLHYERIFGWKLPRALHAAARGGRAPLLGLERDVVSRIRREGLPGVYISTRGDLGLAREILS